MAIVISKKNSSNTNMKGDECKPASRAESFVLKIV